MKKAIIPIALSMAVLAGCSSTVETLSYNSALESYISPSHSPEYQRVMPIKTISATNLLCYRDLPKRGWIEHDTNPYGIEMMAAHPLRKGVFEKDNKIASCYLSSVLYVYDKTELERAKKHNRAIKQAKDNEIERKLNEALSEH